MVSNCVQFHTVLPWREATAENVLSAGPRAGRGRSCSQDQVILGTLPAGLAGHRSSTCLKRLPTAAADLELPW